MYRAIDQFGQVVDVFVGTRRDAKAAHRFFERAVEDPVGRRVAVAFDELALAI